jgi:hypothetical protein
MLIDEFWSPAEKRKRWMRQCRHKRQRATSRPLVNALLVYFLADELIYGNSTWFSWDDHQWNEWNSKWTKASMLKTMSIIKGQIKLFGWFRDGTCDFVGLTVMTELIRSINKTLPTTRRTGNYQRVRIFAFYLSSPCLKISDYRLMPPFSILPTAEQ